MNLLLHVGSVGEIIFVDVEDVILFNVMFHLLKGKLHLSTVINIESKIINLSKM